MALDYSILSKKQEVKFNSSFDETNMTLAIDLLGKDLDLDRNVLEGGLEGLIVQKEYVARPDLISLAVYGSDKYADLICKINGISNPFELNEGDLILYPYIAIVDEISKVQKVLNEFVTDDSATLGKTEKTNKKYVNEKRSPIEATINDHNYVYAPGTTGIIFY